VVALDDHCHCQGNVPCLSGRGIAGLDKGRLSPVTTTPLRPPPPICNALPFQCSGRLTWNLMSGAVGSTDLMPPVSLQ